MCSGSHRQSHGKVMAVTGKVMTYAVTGKVMTYGGSHRQSHGSHRQSHDIWTKDSKLYMAIAAYTTPQTDDITLIPQ
jgi:hypothetical protein